MKKRGMFVAIFAALMLGLGFSPALVSAKTAEEPRPWKPRQKSTAVQQIDINKADAETLTQIPGIGPKTAEAIIAYRKDIGQFKTLEELVEVKGIGPKKLETIKPFLQKI